MFLIKIENKRQRRNTIFKPAPGRGHSTGARNTEAIRVGLNQKGTVSMSWEEGGSHVSENDGLSRSAAHPNPPPPPSPRKKNTKTAKKLDQNLRRKKKCSHLREHGVVVRQESESVPYPGVHPRLFLGASVAPRPARLCQNHPRANGQL